jgi:hypothetical protein
VTAGTVKRRPRRTAEARAQPLEEESDSNWQCDGCKPEPLQPTPEMLTLEYLKSIVEPYLEAKRAYARWEREQWTPGGRKRKTGKALEKALAVPQPPHPRRAPLRGFDMSEFKRLRGELQDLWLIATGWPPMSRFDENGFALNKEAELILEEEERSLEEYNSTHMGGKRNWLKD